MDADVGLLHRAIALTRNSFGAFKDKQILRQHTKQLFLLKYKFMIWLKFG